MQRQSDAGKLGPTTRAALITGAAQGVILGALIGGSLGLEESGIFAIVGALALAPAELISHLMRRQGEAKHEAYRILLATLYGAATGGAVQVLAGNGSPLVFGAAFGIVVGLMGFVGLMAFQSNRVLLGLGSGLVCGALAEALWADTNLAVVGGAIVLLYRVAGAILFGGRDIVSLAGESVSSDQARYIVPFESRTKRVGIDYVQELALERHGSFRRSPPGAGLVARFADLDGSTFESGRVHPLIHDFYEHTSNYTLSIVPSWRWTMMPAYMTFRRGIAEPIGQANLPLNQHETQDGVVSYIDTISFSDPEVVDLRAWVRAYKGADTPIYVGIYTVVRHQDGAYVSVGFPLPKANFTATLRPFNHRGDGLLLRSHDTGSSFTGHYLTSIDAEANLTILKLPALSEEIDVYVENDVLRTDHRFSLSGSLFLTLRYGIVRNN